jgi:hypothetical protein
MTKTTRNDGPDSSSLPVTAQQNANVQVCWERFEALAQAGWPDPRAGGAEIVRTFRDHAGDPELNELRNRIEAECRLKPHVPVGHLREHQFWLAVLEGAHKAARPRC